jgi:hypothetical protein
LKINFEKKSLVCDRSKNDQRIYFHPEASARVVVPYHRKDLPQGILLKFSNWLVWKEKNFRISWSMDE